jgi:RNA polymerase sigma factor (sigma-70 family)
MTALSDEELVRCFLAEQNTPASDAAVNELFRRYTSKVASWCYRVTGNRETAGDLAQEVFLRTYRHLASFQGGSKFSTWLYVVARNHCLNYLKTRATEPSEAGVELSLSLPDLNFPDPANSMEREQSLTLMREMMTDNLDATEIQVMSLHFGEELPLSAVTRVLGLTNPSGAKAYIVSARRKLSVAVQRWSVRSARPAAARSGDGEEQ